MYRRIIAVGDIHDNRLATAWWFKKKPDGTVDFLNNDPAYQTMKTAIHQNKVENQLEALVTAAYTDDSRTGNRDMIYALEKKRTDSLKAEAAAKMRVDESTREEMNGAADAYLDLHQPALAMTQINRLFAANQADVYSYEIRGHDRELITGQNPASDLELAQELDRALQAK